METKNRPLLLLILIFSAFSLSFNALAGKHKADFKAFSLQGSLESKIESNLEAEVFESFDWSSLIGPLAIHRLAIEKQWTCCDSKKIFLDKFHQHIWSSSHSVRGPPMALFS